MSDKLFPRYPVILKTTIKLIFLLIASLQPMAQVPFSQQVNQPQPKPKDSSQTRLANGAPNQSRLWLVIGGHAAIWAGSFIALNKAWYADYSRQSFHLFNDSREWNQVDKAGHGWTAYQMARHSTQAWQWTGLPDKKSIWLGAASGIAYQSIIEIQDGYSAEWGFSWLDMLANAGGASLYLVQELAWHEQRLQLKMSYWPYDYPPNLEWRRDQLFGKSLPERILKDYNSQTYWLSGNLHSFFPQSQLPSWLNVSVGYGSDGLLGGFQNSWQDDNGNLITRYDIPRVRRIFIAPDIDLTKIKSRHKFIRSVLFIANMIKIPAPALEFNSQKKFMLHAIYF